MAFVSQSGKKEVFQNSSPTLSLGPGSYDVESVAHKELMAALYPKKTAPFNKTEIRNLHDKDKKVPGPGDYFVKSDFDRTMIIPGIQQKETYTINDNGHLNQRLQNMANANRKMTTLQANIRKQESPGPGEYNEIRSDFRPTNFTKKQSGPIINPTTVITAISPSRAHAAQSNPALQKMSVPSIPSRFLTPILDANGQSIEGMDDSQDICKMSRLVDDPSKVGPGTYILNEDQVKKLPTSTINWGQSRSQRISLGISPFKNTPQSVGPGAYNTFSQINRGISNPFIPRQGLNSTKYYRNTSASIKGNFLGDGEDSDEEEKQRKISPGPGQYMTKDSSFYSTRAKPTSLQLFGSNVARFTEKPIGSTLGPGQYRLPGKQGMMNNSVIRMAGSAAFKSKERPDMISPFYFDLPGPGEYTNESMRNPLTVKLQKKRNDNSKQQFGVRRNRFDKSDTLPPGPGQYSKSDIEVCTKHEPGMRSLQVGPAAQKHLVLNSACNKKGVSMELASYKSTTDRDLKHIVGKDNPGVGAFNIKDHLSIGVQKIQGGAPNNFLILSKNIDPCIRRVDTMPSPRLHPTEIRTPMNVGPGSYIKTQTEELEKLQKMKKEQQQRREHHFGTDTRFKQSPQKDLPGPGNYKDANKWNKRTYNLKFLNNQTNAALFNNNSQAGFGTLIGSRSAMGGEQKLPSTSIAHEIVTDQSSFIQQQEMAHQNSQKML